MAATAQQVYNALTIHNVFNINNSSAPINYANWDDITDWSSLNILTANGDTVKIIAQVVSPVGVVVYENAGYAGDDYSSPDVDLTDPDAPQFTLPVYTGTSNAINGSYVYNLKVEYTPNGEDAIYVEKTFTISLPKNVTPTLSLTESYDCRVATYTSVDTSSYCTSGCASGYNVTDVVRTHTVYPPQVSGQSEVTADAETVLLGSPSNQLWTGTYEAELSVVITLTNGNYEIITRGSTSTEEKVICDDLLCGLYCLLKSLYNDYKAALGKNTTKANQLQAQWIKGMFAYQMAAHARLCSDESRVATYVNDFYNWTGSDPSCSCCSDEPSPVIPTSVINGTDGTDGETPDFRVTGTLFQYQYPSTPGWTTLFDFSTITGLNGSSFLQGSGVPSGGLGSNGDSYLDIDTGDVYEKSGGSWALTGNIKGADGTNGADGVALLVNDYSVDTTTGTITEVLKSYTIPANTFSTNGDMLEIEVHYIANTETLGAIGKMNIGAATPITLWLKTNTLDGTKATIRLSKASSNSLTLDMDVHHFNGTEVVRAFTAYQSVAGTFTFSGTIALTFDSTDTDAGDTSIKLLRIKKYLI